MTLHLVNKKTNSNASCRRNISDFFSIEVIPSLPLLIKGLVTPQKSAAITMDRVPPISTIFCFCICFLFFVSLFWVEHNILFFSLFFLFLFLSFLCEAFPRTNSNNNMDQVLLPPSLCFSHPTPSFYLSNLSTLSDLGLFSRALFSRPSFSASNVFPLRSSFPLTSTRTRKLSKSSPPFSLPKKRPPGPKRSRRPRRLTARLFRDTSEMSVSASKPPRKPWSESTSTKSAPSQETSAFVDAFFEAWSCPTR